MINSETVFKTITFMKNTQAFLKYFMKFSIFWYYMTCSLKLSITLLST
jgi:hypothetical protein